ncbi:CASP-like protein [Platanthera guangdongensis]|uniref:CASP-like protein n=1 Tax=Platanthera guangdongensis TaxID=2320717 RepID=A0ABR2LKE3_9ASPA
MSRSPYRSPLRQEEVRPSPPPQPPPEPHRPPAARQLTNSIGKEEVLTKAFGFPLRSLSREADGPIPPPPIPSPARSESSSKSPARDGAVVVTSIRSVLEDGGSPLPQLERSAEKPAVANRMAAPAAPIEAKVREGVGKGMRVESGFVERAGLSWAEIGLRVLEVVLCLISFSVMAADKTSGWAGDSFDRYEEFRYCISINIVAFVYSLFQACAEFHHRMKKRPIIEHPLSYYFDFFMDQVSD